LPKLKLHQLTTGAFSFNYGELRTFIKERKLLANKVSEELTPSPHGCLLGLQALNSHYEVVTLKPTY
jgi:hypothetical protein